MPELPVATCREHVKAFLELHWTLYAKKTAPKYGTYLILEHPDVPWFLQVPCPSDEAVLDPVLIRQLIRAAQVTEEEFLRAFRSANSER